MPKRLVVFFLVFIALAAAACSSLNEPQVAYDPAELRFSGERALESEREFVTQFPNRDSGQPNSILAAEWLMDEFSAHGLDCRLDEWTVINYSRPVDMRNVICVLEGESGQEILIAAHHDQSPDTIQGADNDGAGIAILLQLAEIFAAEGRPAHSLVFLASDGEEYGMLGSRRYVQNHPEPESIIAGFSMDNLGKEIYTGLEMSPVGQFKGIGPVWLMRTAQVAAEAAGDLWVPRIRAPIDQVLNQAVPVSLMDQGPMIAAGIPAFGFAGTYPPEAGQFHWDTYHTPEDKIEYLGRFDDYLSIYGHHVACFIGSVEYPVDYNFNKDEIDDYVEAPLSIFVNEEYERVIPYEHEGRSFDVFYYYYKNFEIWGMTARILTDFARKVIKG